MERMDKLGSATPLLADRLSHLLLRLCGLVLIPCFCVRVSLLASFVSPTLPAASKGFDRFECESGNDMESALQGFVLMLDASRDFTLYAAKTEYLLAADHPSEQYVAERKVSVNVVPREAPAFGTWINENTEKVARFIDGQCNTSTYPCLPAD
jgi:hypothetical protein